MLTLFKDDLTGEDILGDFFIECAITKDNPTIWINEKLEWQKLRIVYHFKNKENMEKFINKLKEIKIEIKSRENVIT